ncbi:hypothetical protein CSUB01_03792 [Colletotrichum sublineola]|uniref:Uncharacterized protein n=1 Tax=Colletotrichum sublineola TaxID=1173701 RepID=A0A066WTM4_COLSU|nr:hypothetical protein CSUB01_03792 [Colletotrichum sublineola]
MPSPPWLGNNQGHTLSHHRLDPSEFSSRPASYCFYTNYLRPRAPRAWTRAAISDSPVTQGLDRKLPQIYHGSISKSQDKNLLVRDARPSGQQIQSPEACTSTRVTRRPQRVDAAARAVSRLNKTQMNHEPLHAPYNPQLPYTLVVYASTDEPYHLSMPPLQSAGGRSHLYQWPSDFGSNGTNLMPPRPLSPPHRGDHLRPDCLLADPASAWP